MDAIVQPTPIRSHRNEGRATPNGRRPRPAGGAADNLDSHTEHDCHQVADLLRQARELQLNAVRLLSQLDVRLRSSCLDADQQGPRDLQPVPRPVPPEELTGREREVLRLVGDGATNRLVARRLGISEKTVKNHLSSVFAKLDVTSRSQAVLAAFRLGYLSQSIPRALADEQRSSGRS